MPLLDELEELDELLEELLEELEDESPPLWPPRSALTCSAVSFL